MIDKNIIKKIKDQEMDRKAFLKYSGLALVGLVGLRGLVALLAGDAQQPIASKQNSNSSGFGGGRYGV